ncbi:MAG: DUF1360 domain-containing protein [Actinomycetota bacterium]
MSEGERTRDLFEGYGGDGMPLKGYAVVMGFYNLIFALFLLFAPRAGRKIPERMRLSDILLLGVATHKLSWLLARDPVTAPIRAPFVAYEEKESPTHVSERPRGGGLRRSIGELLGCQFCLDQWIAAFFAYALLLFPAATRLAASVFAVVAVSDTLHQLYKGLMKRA